METLPRTHLLQPFGSFKGETQLSHSSSLNVQVDVYRGYPSGTGVAEHARQICYSGSIWHDFACSEWLTLRTRTASNRGDPQPELNKCFPILPWSHLFLHDVNMKEQSQTGKTERHRHLLQLVTRTMWPGCENTSTKVEIRFNMTSDHFSLVEDRCIAAQWERQ